MQREIDPTLLGQLALDPFYGTTSAARGAMIAAHIGQAPVMVGNEPRRIMTGVEPHYAKHSFDIRVPEDITVLDVIRKYPTGFTEGAIKHNPITTVIYEEYYSPTKTIGVINIPDYIKLHQDFGFPLKRNPEVWDRLFEKANLGKGEVIASSTAIKPNGLYGLGISAEVAFMSDPGGIEDGFVVSEEFLERMAPTTYNKYIANVGKKAVFLNLYGDEKNYKPFPDIGERVRADGVIMATREIDENLAPAEMTGLALRTVDDAFDRCTYAKPGAIVKDIMVLRDTSAFPSNIPTGMDTQLIKYFEAGQRYYQKILDVYNRLISRRGKGLHITPEFNELMVEALTYMPVKQGQRKLTRMYRLEILDEYRVEIMTEAKMIPDNGFKLTDLSGGFK